MMNIINKKKAEKGFTLIELMIVVAIIGILAAIAIPQFAQYRIKAFNSAAAADAKTFVTIMEASYTDSYVYPTQASQLVGPGPITITMGSTTINLSKGVNVAAASAAQAYSVTLKHEGGDKCFSANNLTPTVTEATGSVAGSLAAGNEGTPSTTTAPTYTCP